MNKYKFSDEQRKLLEGLKQPLAIYQFLDKRVVTIVLSNGFCDVFGYESLEQAYFDMENNMYKYAHPDDVARISEAAFRFATEGGTYEVIYRTRTMHSSDYRIIHAMGEHVYTEDGARLAHVWYTDEGAAADDAVDQRTELNRAFNDALREESLARESNYDYLTGLPSMTYFFDLASAAKQPILERGEEPTMLYMDLCGMKLFNAQNTYEEGDDLLREFARALKDAFGDRCCCRVGADHFAAYTVRRGLEDKLELFFQACGNINGGNSLPVRVGIYSNSMGDVTASGACDRAKFACDSIRDVFESRFCYYSSSLLDEAQRRRHILTNLDRALNEKWVQVHYQPIVRAVNGKVCDEEALSRWFDPELGPLSPADFIPALEDAGTIYKLDLYVLDQMLEKMSRQKKAGLDVVPCSINLSRSDFTACDIVSEVAKRVDAAGVSHDLVTIEITETLFGSNPLFMKEQVGRFRDLGFPVWMDDFGSGYSSVDMLQSMEFNLIKFDMSFMRQLDEGDGGKIVLTELVKMATALGVDTLCEGVETAEQARFLCEIGCSKLQGFHFCKALPFEQIVERHEKGLQIGFENPDEVPYYDAIGSVSLYDLSLIANEDDGELGDYFNTLPIAVMEMDGEKIDFIRANQAYHAFISRFFEIDLNEKAAGYLAEPNVTGFDFMRTVLQCCEKGGRVFFDETMPDGSIVHSFVKHVCSNPVNGKKAAAVAVLSVSEANEGATYARIARALAADYYNIYYVDLNTEKFIEYSSQIGGEQLAMERHGERFFETAKHDIMTRIYEEDREQLLASFSKDIVVRELDKQGVYSATYRLIDTGEPVYVSMKITRLHAGGSQIIVGISIVDSQMKQRELYARMQRDREALKCVTALSGGYLGMYSIDPETGRYIEYGTSDEYESLGFAKEGDDFFRQGAEDGKRTVFPDDLPKYLERFTKDNIMREIRESGAFTMQYRLVMKGEPVPVSLRIAMIEESDGEKLVAGVRAWQTRKPEKGPML